MGAKYQYKRLMPNCEHSLAENVPGVVETIGAFILGAWVDK